MAQEGNYSTLGTEKRTGGEGELLSLEKAMALKSAGLQWEPDFGDLYWREECNSDMIYCGAEPDEDDVWLPRLDQLLAEIELRGKYWTIFTCSTGGYIAHVDAYDFKSVSSEDAVADALIWILTKGGLPMGD